MALDWFTLLKAVPWSTVINTAPKAVDGAVKLWQAVGKKRATAIPGKATPVDKADVQARLAMLETAIADLQEQMLASSELIKTLAEQNTQLVRRAEVHRRRVLLLTIAVLAALGCAVAALSLTL